MPSRAGSVAPTSVHSGNGASRWITTHWPGWFRLPIQSSRDRPSSPPKVDVRIVTSWSDTVLRHSLPPTTACADEPVVDTLPVPMPPAPM